MRNGYGVNHGYVGWSESKRSYAAKSVGIYPKTQFKKEYHISDKLFKEIDNAGGFDHEWHHTSKFFNRTDFYKWNETGISIIARKDFEKHLDTILSFCDNAFEYSVCFEWWYDDLWKDDEPFMPLVDLVRDYMLEEQQEEKHSDERKHLYYVNAEWTLRWAQNNLQSVSVVDGLQGELDNGSTLCKFPGDEYVTLEFVNGERRRYILTEESWHEYVKDRYKKTFGCSGSIDINEFIRRGKVAREFRQLARRYKPSEKIHRQAGRQFGRKDLKRIHKNTSDYDYALALYDYYHPEDIQS